MQKIINREGVDSSLEYRAKFLKKADRYALTYEHALINDIAERVKTTITWAFIGTNSFTYPNVAERIEFAVHKELRSLFSEHFEWYILSWEEVESCPRLTLTYLLKGSSRILQQKLTFAEGFKNVGCTNERSWEGELRSA